MTSEEKFGGEFGDCGGCTRQRHDEWVDCGVVVWSHSDWGGRMLGAESGLRWFVEVIWSFWRWFRWFAVGGGGGMRPKVVKL